MQAPYVLEYTYKRSTGPVLGRFLAGLRAGKLLGARTKAGQIIVPPSECDSEGEAIEALVEVATTGSVDTWSWVPHPRPGQPLTRPFAYALIRLDGTHSGFLHVVDAGSPDRLHRGTRVQARFKSERVGSVLDIEAFEVLP